MSQLNIHMTEAFEKKLKRYMRVRGIKTKSDAVRTAVEESLRLAEKPRKFSINDLYGLAKNLPKTPRSQWLTEDDLWEKNGR
jgi:hypothetical protein